jgi:hypothetical protein
LVSALCLIISKTAVIFPYIGIETSSKSGSSEFSVRSTAESCGGNRNTVGRSKSGCNIVHGCFLVIGVLGSHQIRVTSIGSFNVGSFQYNVIVVATRMSSQGADFNLARSTLTNLALQIGFGSSDSGIASRVNVQSESRTTVNSNSDRD